jgi:hypothetical protein
MEQQQNRELGGALALGGCQLIIFYTTTNKKGGWDGGEYGGEVRRTGGAGEAQFHCFGGIGSWIRGKIQK